MKQDTLGRNKHIYWNAIGVQQDRWAWKSQERIVSPGLYLCACVCVRSGSKFGNKTAMVVKVARKKSTIINGIYLHALKQMNVMLTGWLASHTSAPFTSIFIVCNYGCFLISFEVFFLLFSAIQEVSTISITILSWCIGMISIVLVFFGFFGGSNRRYRRQCW